MKTAPFPPPNRRRSLAFTLPEMLMVMGILVLVVGGVIMANLYAVSMSYRDQIWMSASGDAAQALGDLITDIRSGQYIYIGNGNLTGFTNVPTTNAAQVGNALKIYLTQNSNSWVLYYYDTVSNNLCRTNYTGSNYGDFKLVSANPITNDNNIFTETDYLGNVLSNQLATPLIKIYLSFTKLQNPQVSIAPGSPVDFYQIVTTCAARNRP